MWFPQNCVFEYLAIPYIGIELNNYVVIGTEIYMQKDKSCVFFSSCLYSCHDSFSLSGDGICP